jgi:maltose/moltooligosaccharide transporter
MSAGVRDLPANGSAPTYFTMTPSQRLPLGAIWNMSFGFLGIQFGWALQMSNMSAIYQYLGASENEIPLLWLAAPVTGLVVQPIIGYFSDRTWTRLGRRRPYFLVGAIFASVALIAMPNSSSLWMAAGLLWVLDAAVNVSMEPFRAFVGDLLPPAQRKTGFAMQSLLIGIGAVLAGMMPWFLSNVMHVGEGEAPGRIPASVHLSFYIGAAVFLSTVLYTVFTTKEAPPSSAHQTRAAPTRSAFLEIVGGIAEMPSAMKRLAVVQFFTWLGLFCFWIYFTPAVARNVFGATPNTDAYREGVEWGGVCMSVYSGVAAAASIALLFLTRKFSARSIHAFSLVCAGVGLLSVGWWSGKYGLLLSMVGLGIGWASILAMPYALLANSIPPERMGYFMGVFNYFIVIPQILASTLLGWIVKTYFEDRAMPVVLAGGACMLIAAITVTWVREDARHEQGTMPTV